MLANDSYLPNSPISISIKDSSNGTTVITEKIVTYTPLKDFNGSDVFTYTITQTGKTSSANVEISINAVNDEPVINLASTIQVQENQKAVASNFIYDVDTNDSLSLSISGTDADSFDLSSDNDLFFKTAPDYESKKSYSITLTLTDGTATVSKDITILILKIDIAPIFISLPTTIEVNENTLAVHQIKTFDEEGDNIIYSISGIDADEFNLSDYGLISFKSVKDFESITKKRFDITITISDGTNSLSREVIVIINNLIENQLGESVLGSSKLE